jgi:hypothetical protein
MTPLHEASVALGLARAEALLRGDHPAAERLEALIEVVDMEREYAEHVDSGLAQVPIPLDGEWQPGQPDADVIELLAGPDHCPHLIQLGRISALSVP